MDKLVIYISLIGKCTKVYLYNWDDYDNGESVPNTYLFESNKISYLSLPNSNSII